MATGTAIAMQADILQLGRTACGLPHRKACLEAGRTRQAHNKVSRTSYICFPLLSLHSLVKGCRLYFDFAA